MSRQDKLRARFWGNPAPKDFTWDEMVALLKGYGYEISQGSGSRAKFIRPGIPTCISLHTPHPEKTVQVIYIKLVREKLRDEGLGDD